MEATVAAKLRIMNWRLEITGYPSAPRESGATPLVYPTCCFRVWELHCFPAINFLVQKHRWETPHHFIIFYSPPFFRSLFSADSNTGTFIASPVVPWNQYCFIGILSFFEAGFHAQLKLPASPQLIWVNMSNLKNASNNHLQYPLRFYFVFCAIFVLFGGFEYRPNNMLSIPPLGFCCDAKQFRHFLPRLVQYNRVQNDFHHTCAANCIPCWSRLIGLFLPGAKRKGFEHKYVQNGEPPTVNYFGNEHDDKPLDFGVPNIHTNRPVFFRIWL